MKILPKRDRAPWSRKWSLHSASKRVHQRQDSRDQFREFAAPATVGFAPTHLRSLAGADFKCFCQSIGEDAKWPISGRPPLSINTLAKMSANDEALRSQDTSLGMNRRAIPPKTPQCRSKSWSSDNSGALNAASKLQRLSWAFRAASPTANNCFRIWLRLGLPGRMCWNMQVETASITFSRNS